MQLLYAVHNIAPEPVVEPRSLYGSNLNASALKTAQQLYDLMGVSPAFRDGVLLVVRLLAETTCAAGGMTPEKYAKKEIKRGLNDERHCDDGATIQLPHVLFPGPDELIKRR